MSTYIKIGGEKRGSKLRVYNGKGYVRKEKLQVQCFFTVFNVKKDSCKGRAVVRTEYEHSDDCSDSFELFDIIDFMMELRIHQLQIKLTTVK